MRGRSSKSQEKENRTSHTSGKDDPEEPAQVGFLERRLLPPRTAADQEAQGPNPEATSQIQQSRQTNRPYMPQKHLRERKRGPEEGCGRQHQEVRTKVRSAQLVFLNSTTRSQVPIRMKSTAEPRRTHAGLIQRPRSVPAATPTAVARTRASDAAAKIVHGLLESAVNARAASCVLSPSSATKTAPNVSAKSFQSMDSPLATRSGRT